MTGIQGSSVVLTCLRWYPSLPGVMHRLSAGPVKDSESWNHADVESLGYKCQCSLTYIGIGPVNRFSWRPTRGPEPCRHRCRRRWWWRWWKRRRRRGSGSGRRAPPARPARPGVHSIQGHLVDRTNVARTFSSPAFHFITLSRQHFVTHDLLIVMNLQNYRTKLDEIATQPKHQSKCSQECMEIDCEHYF